MSESLLAETRRRLHAAGLAPQHRFGQNFMIDRGALQHLVAAAGPPGRAVEVGPGTGLLSTALLAAGWTVLAVEIDHGLTGLLRERFAGEERFTVVAGDALVDKNTLHPAITGLAADGPWSLVANLPYDIAIPLLLDALQLPTPPQRIAVTVQYEAAQRLCAPPGSRQWGASAALAQAAGAGRIAHRLPPACFHPRPRVDSAILVWEPQRPVPKGFGRSLRHLFAFRRKVVTRALRDAGIDRVQAQAVCAAAGIAPERRLEGLTVAELIHLHEECFQ